MNNFDELHRLIFYSQKLKSNLHQVFNRVAKEYGISVQKMMVLIAVHSKKAQTIGVLANEFSLHQANVSTLIKAMEQEGLLLRTVDDEDIRVNVLSLSKEGENLLKQVSKSLKDIVNRVEGEFNFDLIEEGLKEMNRFVDEML